MKGKRIVPKRLSVYYATQMAAKQPYLFAVKFG